ncbi:MAG: hypothetical protein GTO14_06995, partial [Anaerolineales bacterium]|nr:hypothetical protein [Anaerolineales bacterium]
MSITVWLSAKTLKNPKAGGLFWVYLNWALGLRAAGCQVIWLEVVASRAPSNKLQTGVDILKSLLNPYDAAKGVALCSWNGEPLSVAATKECVGLEEAAEADLLLNLSYGIPSDMVGRFPRSALVDIDPGLTQIWMSEGQITVPRHDVYFTIGETVGQPGALFPDCGLEWQYTPPCVVLDSWPPTRAGSTAPFTTVTNWWERWVEFQGQNYSNGKRDGFLPFLDLPRRTTQALELAVCMGTGDYDANERVMLQEHGWRVRDPNAVASTPWDYQRYIQDSRGEFSCVKPSCVQLQNAWISDRTLCYLASGKPAVVQHTGASRFLPDSAGL